jgi:hypothetical protein
MDLDPNRSWTPQEWRYYEHVSKTKHYELKKHDLAPEELDVDGMRRITPEARKAWREKMAELARSEAAQLEAERRRVQAAEAGRIAAQSLLHVSQRGSRSAPVRRHRRTLR